MKITVFGGTGPTGLLLVQQALAQGHAVTAYARNPSKLPFHARLTVVAGELADAPAIGRAVRGADAVLSLLGPSTNKADVPALINGYRHLIDAMHDTGVTRLVVLGTPSIDDPSDRRDLRVQAMVHAVRLLQPAAYHALVEIGAMVRGSGLDWTIVRIPLLSNQPATSTARARAVGEAGGLRLSRANAAAYVLDQASDRNQVHRAPFVSDI